MHTNDKKEGKSGALEKKKQTCRRKKLAPRRDFFGFFLGGRRRLPEVSEGIGEGNSAVLFRKSFCAGKFGVFEITMRAGGEGGGGF